jgi:hypothetical protein
LTSVQSEITLNISPTHQPDQSKELNKSENRENELTSNQNQNLNSTTKNLERDTYLIDPVLMDITNQITNNT